jgi:hypothetical protein
MMILLPTQSEKEASAELSAIREAGRHILASPERTREFLARLGFGVKEKGAISSSRKASPKSVARGA